MIYAQFIYKTSKTWFHIKLSTIYFNIATPINTAYFLYINQHL